MNWKVVARPKANHRPDAFLAALAETARTGKAVQLNTSPQKIGWVYAYAKKHGLGVHFMRNGANLILWAERRRK